MALVNIKCPNCGAKINVDAGKEATICEYCGNAFVTEKAINTYNQQINQGANIAVQNIYVNTEKISSKDNSVDALLHMYYSNAVANLNYKTIFNLATCIKTTVSVNNKNNDIIAKSKNLISQWLKNNTSSLNLTQKAKLKLDQSINYREFIISVAGSSFFLVLSIILMISLPDYLIIGLFTLVLGAFFIAFCMKQQLFSSLKIVRVQKIMNLYSYIDTL
jgi:hypothetical protein